MREPGLCRLAVLVWMDMRTAAGKVPIGPTGPSRTAVKCLSCLLHNQHDDQLAVADLGAANDEWARLTQFRPCFQQ